MPIVLDGTQGISTPMYAGSISSNAVTPVIGMKNKIINGACVIDQRNAGASVTLDGSESFPLDRFACGDVTDGVFTAQQVTDAPTGFINSLKCTITTADTSLAATQTAYVKHAIEGLNCTDLAWGTTNAKTVTLSFWVKSSLTGTFGGALRNSGASRSYPFNYTISAANTWEYETITIAGDTTGTWLTTNGIGIDLGFSLGAGSSRTGTAGAWNANNNTGATGQVQVIGTLNATWQVTGVQLEVGSTATSFDYRPYGTELALCQRYCQRYRSAQAFDFYGMVSLEDSSTVNGSISFPTTMRSAPSATLSAGNTFRIYTTGGFTASAISFQSASINSAVFFLTVSGATGGQAGKWQDAGSNNSSITLSAEL